MFIVGFRLSMFVTVCAAKDFEIPSVCVTLAAGVPLVTMRTGRNWE